MAAAKQQYTTNLLAEPGMTFAVGIKDPKERVQAYLDAYKKNGNPEVSRIKSAYKIRITDVRRCSTTP
jgi:hypothetical protein